MQKLISQAMTFKDTSYRISFKKFYQREKELIAIMNIGSEEIGALQEVYQPMWRLKQIFQR